MSRRGVTLIELVVGLTIASTLVAAGYAALTTIVDRREAALSLLEEEVAATSIRSTLRGWLRGAYTVAGSSAPIFSGVDAESDAGESDDQLAFLTSAETPLGAHAATVRLYIDRNPETPEQGLVAEVRAWLGTERVRVVLVPEATGLNVRYRSGLVGGREWLPSWISSTVMPAGVEVWLSGAAGPGRGVHPLLAYPVRQSLQGGR